MEYLSDTTINPPYGDDEYRIRIIDYGQGIKRLSIKSIEETKSYVFYISNLKKQECQWRNKNDSIPNEIHKAVEYYGYHITDEPNLPRHGFHQNVKYIGEILEDISGELHDADYLAKASMDWIQESINLLEKLEILRAHMTDVEFEVVCCKAYESSANDSGGLINMKTAGNKEISTTLNLLVMRIIAYAQKDKYINIEIISPELVEKLTMEPPQ